MPSPNYRINWQTISHDDFDRVVEALLVRDAEQDPGLYGRAISGRGGDGGIDVDVRVKSTDQLVRIYQLKFFPEGFSSGHAKSRWPQIKHSFNAALNENPPTWVLVTPANCTRNERKRVGALKGKRKMYIQFMGQAELDNLLAKYPDIHDMMTRDAARDALRIVNRESAAPKSTSDVAAEVARATALGDSLSMYWGVKTSLQDGVQMQELYPKRPDAALREPWSISASVEFGSGEETLRSAFFNKLRYGVSDQVRIPEHALKSFELSGLSWLDVGGIPSELSLLSNADGALVGKVVHVSTVDTTGVVLGSISGTVTHSGSGLGGVSVEAQFPGGLKQQWRFDLEQSEMTAEMQFDLAGQSGRGAVRVYTFMDTLLSAESVQVELDGHASTLRLTGEGRPRPSEISRAFIEDLAFIEKALDIDFTFPNEEVDVIDRIWTRVIRIILEGKPTLIPRGLEGFEATLSDREDAGLEQMLTTPGRPLISNTGWELELFGSKLRLGDVSYFHPLLEAIEGQAHLDAVRRGDGAGRKVRFTSDIGAPFIIFSPSRLPPGSGLVPEPWGIPEISEHQALSKAQELAKDAPYPPDSV